MSRSEGTRCLLVIEDDLGLQRQIKWCFEGYEVVTAQTVDEALTAVRRHAPAVVLQDLGLPPDPAGVSEGLRCVRTILSLAPHTKVVVMTGNGDQNSGVLAINEGAWDFYSKPVDAAVLRLIVDRAFHVADLEARARRAREDISVEMLDGIIAVSDVMVAVCRKIEKVAPADVSVLLLGESGTGKELLARALHTLSSRRDKRFVAINCAAIPENLLESELFGYEKGAFTGAAKTTPGKVEAANGGTLLLDEIGDMPSQLQAKLLRFLQERTIERVGGRQEIPVDVRIVCATNQDLDELIKTGRFRADLSYRINEVCVRVPALRERRECIPVIARHLLQRYSGSDKGKRKSLSSEALEAIAAYAWPGNVRELEGRLKMAAVMADGAVVGPSDMSLPAADGAQHVLTLRDVRHRAELNAIRQALGVAEGNISRAADLLGVTRPTLYDLMEKYGLGAADREKAAPDLARE